MDKTKVGLRGEGAAVEFLRRNGYKILKRNYRSALGEIDVVARDGKTLVFVEVKTGHSASGWHPAESVDSRKQKRIAKVAAGYLRTKRIRGGNCRFDVVSILLKENDAVEKVELIKNAFCMEERL